MHTTSPRPRCAAGRAAAGGIAVALLAPNLLATPTGPIPPASDPAATGMLVRPPATPLYNWLSDSLPTLLIVAGALVVVSVLVSRAKAAKAPKPPSLEERFASLIAARAGREASEGGRSTEGAGSRLPARPAATGRAAATPAPQGELDAVIRDTEELAQRLAAVMDARAARLEGLIREADERLRRLEQARTPFPASAPVPQPPAGSLPSTPFMEPRPEPARVLPDGGVAVTRARVPSFEVDSAEPMHRQVFDLADQGLHTLEIARRLGQPTGQVELILALRGR